jgi:hypothetical protein
MSVDRTPRLHSNASTTERAGPEYTWIGVLQRASLNRSNGSRRIVEPSCGSKPVLPGLLRLRHRPEEFTEVKAGLPADVSDHVHANLAWHVARRGAPNDPSFQRCGATTPKSAFRSKSCQAPHPLETSVRSPRFTAQVPQPRSEIRPTSVHSDKRLSRPGLASRAPACSARRGRSLP